jgi:predicted DNA-binding transcriptional regulator AlpA
MQESEKIIFSYNTGENPKLLSFGSSQTNFKNPDAAKSSNFGLVADDVVNLYRNNSKSKFVSRKHKLKSNAPLVIEPRGLRRDVAAAYLGVSPSYFDQLIAKNLVPVSRRLGTVMIWDRRELDQCFSEIFENNDCNDQWDYLLSNKGINL